MMITKIEIKKKVFNATTEEIKTVTETVTRAEYSGDFDSLVLKHIDNWDIREYAEHYCDMIDEDDVEEKELHHFDENEIIDYLEEAGHKVIKCQTITDSMRFDELKEIMAV